MVPKMSSPRVKVKSSTIKSKSINRSATANHNHTRTKEIKSRVHQKLTIIVNNALFHSINKSPEVYKKYYLRVQNGDKDQESRPSSEIVKRHTLNHDFWMFSSLVGQNTVQVVPQDPLIVELKEKLLTLSYYYHSLPLEYLFLNWSPSMYYGIGTQELTQQIVSQDFFRKQSTRHTQCVDTIRIANIIQNDSLCLTKQLLDSSNISLLPIENSANPSQPLTLDQTVEQENKVKSINRKLKKYLDTTLNKLQRRRFISSSAKKTLMEMVENKSMTPGNLRHLSIEDLEFLLNDVKLIRRRTVGGRYKLILNEFDGNR